MPKKILSSIRAEERTIDNMDSAIKKYNETNMFSITRSEFIRLGLELLSQLILQDKELPIKIQ